MSCHSLNKDFNSVVFESSKFGFVKLNAIVSKLFTLSSLIVLVKKFDTECCLKSTEKKPILFFLLVLFFLLSLKLKVLVSFIVSMYCLHKFIYFF